MSIALNDEHLEVLYILLNDEHDPKYFLPHFQATCAELSEAGYIALLTKIQKKLKPTIEAPGMRAFLATYNTHDIKLALKTHAMRLGMTKDHCDLLEKLVNGNPIPALSIDNELNAFDLVNLGYAVSLFPSSGAVYYSATVEGRAYMKEHYEEHMVATID